MATQVHTPDITERAMLVRFSVSMWTARKHDRRGDAAVESAYKAYNAGRYNKMLVAEDAVKAVAAVANAARAYHYANTLPWSDQGDRLLPLANFQAYSVSMREHHTGFDGAVSVFVSSYNDLVDDARRRLNGLFTESDYPRDIRARFGWTVDILPVPTGADFRVNLQTEELGAIRSQIEERTQAAVATAQADLYRRLAEAVGHMADKLGDDKAIFRDSLVVNLQELVELLPRLNLADDPQLEAIRQEVAAKLCRYEPQTLRESAAARTETARNASLIAGMLGGIHDQGQ